MFQKIHIDLPLYPKIFEIWADSSTLLPDENILSEPFSIWFYKMRTQNNISHQLDDIITVAFAIAFIQNGSSSESLSSANPNYRYWYFSA